MGKLNGLLRLIRPTNCLMVGLAVIVGAALASPEGLALAPSWRNLVLGFITGFTLTAASMSINDYYDREIDAINEPKRPIPSGLVAPEEAIAVAVVLSIIGFVSAYFTNLSCLGIALIAWLLLMTYITVGKRTGLPGNFLVSACVAVPLIYGSFAIADFLELNVPIFATMAFLANTGREITKGIVDAKGDRLHNVQTLAVRSGERTAAASASIFYLLSVSLSPVPWLLSLVSFWFIPVVAVTDIGLIASSFQLVRDQSRENAKKVKTSVLVWLAVGLLAFIVGSIR